MDLIGFDQQWQSPRSPEQTWELLVAALEDSKASPLWPSELSEIAANPLPVRQGVFLDVKYRIGPLKSSARYRLTIFEPPRRLAYRAEPSHPLEGGAEITIEPNETGSTCRWAGGYAPRKLWGWVAIVWFKGVFEPLFFGRLRQRLKLLR